MENFAAQLQQEAHNAWLFIDALLTTACYTGLVLVPVVLLAVSWLQAKARSAGR